jgi:hypothetical protein
MLTYVCPAPWIGRSSNIIPNEVLLDGFIGFMNKIAIKGTSAWFEWGFGSGGEGRKIMQMD